MQMPSLLEHRPGDAPHLFDLGTGSVAIGADGKVVRFTQPGLVMALHPVALEPAGLVFWHVAWRRHADGPDPANDAVSAGVDWLDANKMILARRLITTDTDLLVESGRRTASRLVGPIGMAKAELEAPLDARYVRPWVEVFGTGHATDIEICACLEVPAKSLSTEEIDAPDVLFPEGFQWPERVIPPIPITPTTQDGPEPGLYQPDPATLIPVDWVAPAEIAQTIFVSGGGADTNGGRDVRDAFRSIEQAAATAAADPDTQYSIAVYPGTYPTEGSIEVPDNVTEVVGVLGQRSVQIIPVAGFEERNVFLLGGGMLRNLSSRGFRVDRFDRPTVGFLAAFRPGAMINRAVYIDHCVAYRPGDPEVIPAALDPDAGNPLVPRGPGIALADAAIVNPFSAFPQIMIEASTTSAPNGVGYVARNGAFINGLNTISIWPHKHFLAQAGGELLLNNCACQFGDYTLWAEGTVDAIRPEQTTGPIVADAAAANVVLAAKLALEQAAWDGVFAGGFAGVTDEASTRRDAGYLVDALYWDLAAGQEEATAFFIRGLYPQGQFVGAVPASFIAGWQGMRAAINTLSIPADARAMASGLLDALIDTVQSPRFTTKPSQISATAQQFNFPFGGVNRRAFIRRTREVPDTIVERDLGRVTFSGVDDRGKQYFTGGALVNPLTGKLEGPPIPRTINPLAFEAAIIMGGQS